MSYSGSSSDVIMLDQPSPVLPSNSRKARSTTTKTQKKAESAQKAQVVENITQELFDGTVGPSHTLGKDVAKVDDEWAESDDENEVKLEHAAFDDLDLISDSEDEGVYFRNLAPVSKEYRQISLSEGRKNYKKLNEDDSDFEVDETVVAAALIVTEEPIVCARPDVFAADQIFANENALRPIDITGIVTAETNFDDLLNFVYHAAISVPKTSVVRAKHEMPKNKPIIVSRDVPMSFTYETYTGNTNAYLRRAEELREADEAPKRPILSRTERMQRARRREAEYDDQGNVKPKRQYNWKSKTKNKTDLYTKNGHAGRVRDREVAFKRAQNAATAAKLLTSKYRKIELAGRLNTNGKRNGPDEADTEDEEVDSYDEIIIARPSRKRARTSRYTILESSDVDEPEAAEGAENNSQATDGAASPGLFVEQDYEEDDESSRASDGDQSDYEQDDGDEEFAADIEAAIDDDDIYNGD